MAVVEAEPMMPFGARVRPALSETIIHDEAQQLRRLLAEHKLLVCPRAHLEEHEHRALAETFGNVLGPPDSLDISNLNNDDGLGANALTFHSDLAFNPDPYRVITLAAVSVEDGVSSTLFANCVLACQDLPASLQARTRDAEVRNIFSRDLGFANTALSRPGDPVRICPMVQSHPVTGEPFLSLNYQHTERVMGLADQDSRTLLGHLCDHLYRREHIYEHTWYGGDLVLWDNLAVHHARRDVSKVGARVLRKFAVGPRSFADQNPNFQMQSFLGGVGNLDTAANVS